MITLTTEQAQQIEEALMKIADLRNLGKIQPEVIAFETLYIIRAAMAQEQAEQEQYPTYGFCPICGSRGISRERRINGNDTCANGHSYASNLALHIAPEKQAEQEPVAIADGTFNHNCPLGTPLYAAPLAQQDTHATHAVRTKDLTSGELSDLVFDYEPCENPFKFARAVIAADREKNK